VLRNHFGSRGRAGAKFFATGGNRFPIGEFSACGTGRVPLSPSPLVGPSLEPRRNHTGALRFRARALPLPLRFPSAMAARTATDFGTQSRWQSGGSSGTTRPKAKASTRTLRSGRGSWLRTQRTLRSSLIDEVPLGCRASSATRLRRGSRSSATKRPATWRCTRAVTTTEPA
jgi:hypothetical protein